MSRIWIGALCAVILVSVCAYMQERDAPGEGEDQSKAAPTTVPESLQPPAVPTVASPARPVSVASTSSSTPNAATSPGVVWKRGIATIFWVGESEDEDNGYITNVESAWDNRWEEHFGGLDDPADRCGFEPCGFKPKENTFYVALPYNDLDDEGDQKANASRIPWYRASEGTILKNRWVEVRANGTSCFGQWQDVGPFHEDDIEYVFGAAKGPLNQEGEKAGIDLSPAMRDCLRIGGVSDVEWRHVEDKQVPAGPWKKTITTRGLHW